MGIFIDIHYIKLNTKIIRIILCCNLFRILFQWLATMKPQNLTFDSVDIGSPEETLRGLQTQRTTYAMAYNTLCKYVTDVSFLPSFIRSIYVNNIPLL